MIIKSYEINKINLKKNNVYLLYGENEGFKNKVINDTFKKFSKNIYKYDEQSIYHADLYRINNLKDLNEIGFFDIINQKSWVFVEWPEIIINIIDSPYSIVKISNEGKQKRKLLIKNS